MCLLLIRAAALTDCKQSPGTIIKDNFHGSSNRFSKLSDMEFINKESLYEQIIGVKNTCLAALLLLLTETF